MIYVCVNHLKASNSGLGKRQLPGLPAMTSTVPSQICSEQRPVFVVQTYQIQCMEPWKAMTHLLELLSKVSESHSTPIPQEQHLLEEGFLQEVDRRV